MPQAGQLRMPSMQKQPGTQDFILWVHLLVQLESQSGGQ